MRLILIFLVLFSLISCKKEIKTETIAPENQKTVTDSFDEQPQDNAIILNENELENRQNKQVFRLNKAKNRQEELVISKHLHKENEFYELDYTFPYLNEDINKSFVAFNMFMEDNYLNIEKVTNQILEDTELLCDTLRMERVRDKRLINYKVHNAKDDLLSIVIYKENYYSGAVPATSSFTGLNYNLDSGEFLDYDYFFQRDSEREVLFKINEVIKRNIMSGDMYYDCWQISDHDFNVYKNNFVINDSSIEFYFDDCIMCPAYTGIYSLEIPTWELKDVLKNYNPPEIPLL